MKIYIYNIYIYIQHETRVSIGCAIKEDDYQQTRATTSGESTTEERLCLKGVSVQNADFAIDWG